MLGEQSFRQVEMERWPSGKDRSIAVVRMEPPELETRYGLIFSDEHDDLDYLSEAAVLLPSGRRLLFVRYRRNQAPGTEVRTDGDDDPQSARDELLRALGMDETIFSWVPDEAPLSGQ
jgi:hypothetical protein